MADTQDLKSCAHNERAGSSPALGTNTSITTGENTYGHMHIPIMYIPTTTKKAHNHKCHNQMDISNNPSWYQQSQKSLQSNHQKL